VDPKKIGGYLHAKDLLFVWRGVLPLVLAAAFGAWGGRRLLRP